MPNNRSLIELRDILASLFPTVDQSRAVVYDAKLDSLAIQFQNASRENWHSIIRQAENEGKLSNLIQVARDRFPNNPYLEKIAKGQVDYIVSPEDEEELDWQSEETADTLEKLIGKQSTLLPISFLEVGIKKSESVARIKLQGGELGTGFLIQNNLLVTNAHVFPTEKVAKNAVAQFRYQKTADGLDLDPTELHFKPQDFFLSSKVSEGDWSVIRMKDDANKDWGYIELRENEVKEQDFVNIIQHPGGGPKQIALYHNVVTHSDDNVIQYLTDTLPGSSGSPVFDSDWGPVALHRRGGWITEPGLIKRPVYRNEGTNINQIVRALNAVGEI